MSSAQYVPHLNIEGDDCEDESNDDGGGHHMKRGLGFPRRYKIVGIGLAAIALIALAFSSPWSKQFMSTSNLAKDGSEDAKENSKLISLASNNDHKKDAERRTEDSHDIDHDARKKYVRGRTQESEDEDHDARKKDAKRTTEDSEDEAHDATSSSRSVPPKVKSSDDSDDVEESGGDSEDDEERSDDSDDDEQIVKLSDSASESSSSSYSTSTTRFYPGDGTTTDSQVGACGSAVLSDVYSTLSSLSLDIPWFPVAIAQSMAQPLMCDTADEDTGTGSPSEDGAGYDNVLHLYCGQCVQFTSDDGTVAGGVVLDTCPHSTNEGNCPMDGNENDAGYYNHLDFYGASSSDVTDVIGSNPSGTVELVDCPSDLTAALKTLADASSSSSNPVCAFYWDSGKWQGSPGMDIYGCSECTGSGDGCDSGRRRRRRRRRKGWGWR